MRKVLQQFSWAERQENRGMTGEPCANEKKKRVHFIPNFKEGLEAIRLQEKKSLVMLGNTFKR